MSRRIQGLLVLASAGLALGLVANGDFTRYVKPSMKLPLVLAGGLLAFLGVAAVLDRAKADAHTPRVAWLLVAPLVVVVLAAPGPLGAGAARQQPTREPPSPRDFDGGPLAAPVDGAVDLRVCEFARRARSDDQYLVDTPVRLVGITVHDGDEVQVVRFVLWCCAADATPYRVALRGLDGPAPPDDTWIQVVGTWRQPPADSDLQDRGYTVEMNVDTLTEVPAPENPYEIPTGLY